MLADEPTAALDEKSGRKVIELLQALTREVDATVLIVTHDPRVLDSADRIVNMVDGRIVADQRVKESLDLCALMQTIEPFAELGAAAIAEIAQTMTRVRHPPGEAVVVQGDAADSFYVIAEGTAAVEADDKVVATLEPSDFFGETALLTGAPRNATVRATAPLVVYALPKETFSAAVKRSSSFENQLLKVMFQRSR